MCTRSHNQGAAKSALLLAAVLTLGHGTWAGAEDKCPHEAVAFVPTIDELYVSFQLYDPNSESARAFFDIEPYYRNQLTEAEAEALAGSISRNLAEMLPFFTDERLAVLENFAHPDNKHGRVQRGFGI